MKSKEIYTRALKTAEPEKKAEDAKPAENKPAERISGKK